MDEHDVGFGPDDNLMDHAGVRLKGDIDIGELTKGGVEFSLDEDSLPKNNMPDETSNYFEETEVYKTSEFYYLGESDSSDEDENLGTFEKLEKRMVPISGTDGGVLKRVLREGMGPEISEFIEEQRSIESAKPESERKVFEDDDINVAYHYTANTELDLEPFDNSYLRSERPQRAYLNTELFPGFRTALMSMKEKEISDFLISPDWAFGKLGVPPRIPPNATLRYKIELYQFWATTEFDTYFKMKREERKLVPVKKLIKMCSQQREQANKLYNELDYRGANYIYSKAIRILEDANLLNDSDEILQQKALLKLYLNKAMVTIKLQKFDQTITYSNKALEIDKRNIKALYRKASAKKEFRDFEEAKRIAQQAHNINPNDQSIGKLLVEIQSEERRQKDAEKHMYARMFKLESANKSSQKFTPEVTERVNKMLSDFVSSQLSELKLSATTYTNAELEALSSFAHQHQLNAIKNKEKNEWISLKLTKQSDE